jgi:hypothetical protein
MIRIKNNNNERKTDGVQKAENGAHREEGCEIILILPNPYWARLYFSSDMKWRKVRIYRLHTKESSTFMLSNIHRVLQVRDDDILI